MKQIILNKPIMDRYIFQKRKIDRLPETTTIDSYILARTNDNRRVIVDLAELEDVKKSIAEDIREQIESDISCLL